MRTCLSPNNTTETVAISNGKTAVIMIFSINAVQGRTAGLFVFLSGEFGVFWERTVNSRCVSVGQYYCLDTRGWVWFAGVSRSLQSFLRRFKTTGKSTIPIVPLSPPKKIKNKNTHTRNLAVAKRSKDRRAAVAL